MLSVSPDQSRRRHFPTPSRIFTGPTRSAAPARRWRNAARCMSANGGRRRCAGVAPWRGRMANFWTGDALATVITVGQIFAVVVPVLLAIAFLDFGPRHGPAVLPLPQRADVRWT